MATITDEQAPLELLERAIPGATNDALLELTLQVFEKLAERAEAVVDFAIDADDRDAENEALVFVTEADKLFGWVPYGAPDRVKGAAHVVDDAKRDIETAIRNRRERLEGRRTAVAGFTERRNRRAYTAWELERDRDQRKSDELLERANVTPERVLEALERAMEHSSGDELRPVEVAVALMPELADARLPGRQRVVTHVARVLTALAIEGRIVQVRPDDYDGRRKLHRYALPEGDDA